LSDVQNATQFSAAIKKHKKRKLLFSFQEFENPQNPGKSFHAKAQTGIAKRRKAKSSSFASLRFFPS
jgi:hypothetical protein